MKKCDTETQPVHKIELFCLLKHEVRKIGDTAKYYDYMEEARKLYEEKSAETNPLSEVFYLNSFARFLTKKTIPNEARKVCLKSLQTCEEKPPEHPQRAATLILLFIG